MTTGAHERHPVVIVAGPTASGKSDLALAIAEAMDGVVINADSMQVYRGLCIVTDQPGDAAEARAPHRLYGIIDPGERCSAGYWRSAAVAEIAAARGNDRLPVVVGGTGFYLKALIEGLSPVPEIPADVRAAVHERLVREGGAALHAALAMRDPKTAARIEPGDMQRLARAWEVLEATGRPLSDWHRHPRPESPDGLSFRTIRLDPPRAHVYAACDARFLRMIERGALDEIKALAARNLADSLPAMRALGVQPLTRHLRGEETLAQAVGAAQQATRNYAKRQMTWFRHQLDADHVFDAQFSESMFPEIFPDIRQFLLTEPA